MRAAVLVTVALFAISPSIAGDETERPNLRPNLLLIFTDDQGLDDVGCYGSEIPTPHIDSLARAGLKFDAWYVASSICTPSRYGLLTGRYPGRSRDRLLGALMYLSPADKSRGIHGHEITYAELLRRSGYRTALVGKWHLGHGEKRFWPTRHGFESFYGHTAGCIDYFEMKYGKYPDWYRDEEPIEESGFATRLITDEAVRFLSRQRPERPFYLHLAYNAPHFGKGWDAEGEKVVNILQPRPEELRRVAHIGEPKRRQFAAMVVALDDGIGRVLKALDESGLSRSTLVVFMTDHGGDPRYGGNNRPFRSSKATLFEGGVRVPCLMRWPGKIRAGTTTPAVASALDIFPTFCHLAGVDPSRMALDGRDIRPIIFGTDEGLFGTGEGAPRELFWQLGRHAELDRGAWTALRRGRWKYVQTPKRGDWLFDLGKDPHEKSNLAASRPEILAEMKARSAALLRSFEKERRAHERSKE